MIGKVYADRVLLERVPPEETLGGYILPEDSIEESLIGKVSHKGKDVNDTEIGDYVVFDQYDSRSINIGGTDFVLTKEENLICKLEVKDGKRH
jgi:co-chaperonin GroES (HSP10)